MAEKFFRQINNPVLTNIQINWKGTGEMPLIYPSVVPDLFAEQPLFLFGRKLDRTSGNICVKGVAAGGEAYEKTFYINFEETGNPAIAQLWGRARIKDLMKSMVSVETTTGVEEVTDTALTYQLLSQYTAFVAVSDDVRINSESTSLSMQVPVEMPEGVSNDRMCGSSGSSRFLASLSQITRSNIDDADDSFDLTLSSPGLLDDDSEDIMFGDASVVKLALPSQLEIISVTGLDEAAINALKSYLQQLNLPNKFNGEIAFEFSVKNGRVRQISLDEQASTVKEVTMIDLIKRSLFIWKVPKATTGKVHLSLRINY